MNDYITDIVPKGHSISNAGESIVSCSWDDILNYIDSVTLGNNTSAKSKTSISLSQ